MSLTSSEQTYPAHLGTVGVETGISAEDAGGRAAGRGERTRRGDRSGAATPVVGPSPESV